MGPTDIEPKDLYEDTPSYVVTAPRALSPSARVHSVRAPPRLPAGAAERGGEPKKRACQVGSRLNVSASAARSNVSEVPATVWLTRAWMLQRRSWSCVQSGGRVGVVYGLCIDAAAGMAPLSGVQRR